MKILVWGVALAGLIGMAMIAAMISFGEGAGRRWDRASNSTLAGEWLILVSAKSGMEYKDFSDIFELAHFGNPALLIVLWPLYGFCFGQFFGQVTGRAVIGFLLAIMVTPVAAGLWLPSLLFGGVSPWQILFVPAGLLLITRLTAWPWLSGRLSETKTKIGIAGGAAFLTTSVIGCLWYRAIEVPDMLEPFDVRAFQAEMLVTGNKAKSLLESASNSLESDRTKINEELGLAANWSATINVWDEELTKDDPARDRWLDRLFAGDWVKEAEEAARLPLGVFMIHRAARYHERPEYSREIAMGQLFIARAFQLQARGDLQAALNHLDTALGIARQLTNYSTNSGFMVLGYPLGTEALRAYHRWLKTPGGDQGLLRAGLRVLQQQEKAALDSMTAIKAEYWVFQKVGPPFLAGMTSMDRLMRLAYQAPWEQERQNRLVRAVVAGQLRAIRQSPVVVSISNLSNPPDLAALNGLPPPQGPGSDLDANRWGILIGELFASFPTSNLVFRRRDAAQGQRDLRAAQMVTALALYQADRGSPPARLEQLVPDYLASLPKDPFGGESFHYRISQGEVIDRVSPPVTLEPGQALLWSERDASVADPHRMLVYPVPLGKVKKGSLP